ncbi:flagellar protein FlgJ [Desulfitispora alkaliphila]|uniref:rod-binding protein n=1 Tax=Desulfitispora alkaliphila TaxID=622674 RepID=UPI003D235E83
MKVDMTHMMQSLPGKSTGTANAASDKSQADSFAKALEKAAEKQDSKELKAAAQQFESYFLHHMLKQMRSTVPKSDLMPTSFAEEIYQDMLDQEYSTLMAEGKGIGLADLIYKQLKETR